MGRHGVRRWNCSFWHRIAERWAAMGAVVTCTQCGRVFLADPPKPEER